MKKVMILYNTTSGKDQGKKVCDDFMDYAKKNSSEELELFPQAIGPDIPDDQALEAAKKAQIDTLVIIGGDGTISRMIAVFREQLSELNIGLLPGGTVNNVAQALNIPMDFTEAAKVILSGQTKAVDYGVLGDQSIISSMTIGILADSAARVTQKEKQKYGKLVFLRNFIRALVKKKRYHLEFEIDQKKWQGKTQLVAVVMTNSIGGYRNFDAQARPDDGLFHLIILPSVNTFRLTRYLPKILLGKINEIEDLDYFTGKHIKIRSLKNEKVVTRVDGDPSQDLPVELSIMEKGMTVFAPEEETAVAVFPK